MLFKQAAESVNYSKIIESVVGKDGTDSPSPFRKILGQETRLEKYLSNSSSTIIKPPATRKSDLWLPKNVQAAVDLHVREVANLKLQTLTELVHKLIEICENEILMAR